MISSVSMLYVMVVNGCMISVLRFFWFSCSVLCSCFLVIGLRIMLIISGVMG